MNQRKEQLINPQQYQNYIFKLITEGNLRVLRRLLRTVASDEVQRGSDFYVKALYSCSKSLSAEITDILIKNNFSASVDLIFLAIDRLNEPMLQKLIQCFRQEESNDSYHIFVSQEGVNIPIDSLEFTTGYFFDKVLMSGSFPKIDLYLKYFNFHPVQLAQKINRPQVPLEVIRYFHQKGYLVYPHKKLPCYQEAPLQKTIYGFVKASPQRCIACSEDPKLF